MLQQTGDLLCFSHVVLVLHKSPRLGCQSTALTLTFSRLGDRLACGLSTTQTAPPGDFVQRIQSVTTETQRHWLRSRRHLP